METLCQQCGDRGFENAFVYCVKCLNYPVHRYCLPELPETFDVFVRWLCEDCEPKSGTQFPSKESSSIPSPKVDHAASKDVPLRSSKIKLKTKVRQHLNSSIKQTFGAKKKHDLVKHNELADDFSHFQTNIETATEKGSKSPVNATAKKRDRNELSNCDRKVDDCPGQREQMKRKKSKRKEERVRSPVPESDEHEHEHENSPSQESCEKDKTLALCSGSSSHLNEIRIVLPFKEIRQDAELVRNTHSQTTSCDWSITLEQKYHMRAEPVIDPIWSGSFNIDDEDYGLRDGVVAHLSSKACQKVCEEAGLLPESLCLEMLKKTAVWPKSFQSSEPSDDNIALYFFPINESYRKLFDRLVDDMMSKDLAMKAVVRNAELLVFSSVELPLTYWRFEGKFFLWGVFRGKQASSSCAANDLLVRDSENDYPKAENLTKVKALDATSPNSPLSNNSSLGRLSRSVEAEVKGQ